LTNHHKGGERTAGGDYLAEQVDLFQRLETGQWELSAIPGLAIFILACAYFYRGIPAMEHLGILARLSVIMTFGGSLGSAHALLGLAYYSRRKDRVMEDIRREVSAHPESADRIGRMGRDPNEDEYLKLLFDRRAQR
jgi:hypothetical protein